MDQRGQTPAYRGGMNTECKYCHNTQSAAECVYRNVLNNKKTLKGEGKSLRALRNERAIISELVIIQPYSFFFFVFFLRFFLPTSCFVRFRTLLPCPQTHKLCRYFVQVRTGLVLRMTSTFQRLVGKKLKTK